MTVDRAAGTATVPAGLTYAQVALALEPHGVALHSLASLPHISVGGSNATATHGSGDANGNLDSNLVRRTRRPRHPTGRENLDPPAR